MAFTFLRSYQPDTEQPDDEEEEDEMPMARSGSVRAFSHLPDRAAEGQGTPPPQVIVGRSGGLRPYSPVPAHEEDDGDEGEMPMARSGSVRAFSHLPDSTEDVDGVGGHQAPGPAAAPQARGQGEEPDSGFVFHPQEQGDDHDPDSGTMDHPNEGRSIDPGFAAQAPAEWGSRTRDSGFEAAVPRPAAGSAGMTGLPKSLLFEKRLPPGFRATGSGQPRGRSDIPDATLQQVAVRTDQPQQGRSYQQAAMNGRLGASQVKPAQSNDAVQQNSGAGAAPKPSGANVADSALQEHNRVRLLDETDPGKPPKQRIEGTNSQNKPKDQFEREKLAYEKAKATAAANHKLNRENEQTLKAWENYDRAIQLMENTPEGKKVLDHLRNDKTRVFKVIMVNDSVKDSYKGISIKPGAQGQYVDTGKKDEMGREIHVLFLTKSALESNALKSDGTVNPDAEALEKVWHELYHAYERHTSTSGGVDPLALGTARGVDRLSQQPSAHERRAVRFENIIRARNGGVRMKDKYGGRYVKGPDGQSQIVDVINVPEEKPPWYAPTR